MWETVIQVKSPKQQYQKTQYAHTHTRKIQKNSLVYTNAMGWLGDGSHRGQGHQAWTSVGLLLRYPVLPVIWWMN